MSHRVLPPSLTLLAATAHPCPSPPPRARSSSHARPLNPRVLPVDSARFPSIQGASALAFTMVPGTNICIQKTLYEVLCVTEDATYEEIRAAYKSAALNTHPDKAQPTLEPSVPSDEQQGFLSVQKAWEVLRHPDSRAEYDKQLQSSRQNIEIIASEIEVADMIVESTADTVELLYPCRCGDYFSITSHELGKMGVLITGDGEVELQTSDSVSASIVLGCGSCSLKVRLIIDKTS